ncbi:MAG: hypothetical protein IT288_15380 [Bdellovibrionales bacterium]|nr:hypothetical protein [Bdellovibrionales bacterium]
MVRRFALAVMAVLVLSLLPHFHDHSGGNNGAVGSSCAACLAGGSTAAVAPPDTDVVVAAEYFVGPLELFVDSIKVGAHHFLTSARPRDPPFQKS